jgi:hypothetical protein
MAIQLALRLLGLGQQSRRPIANAQITFGKRERSAFRRHASQTYRKITNYSSSDNPLGGDQQGHARL